MDQDLVILLATSGMYYCLAVLRRDHPAFMDVPDSSVIDALIESCAEDVLEVGDNSEDIYTRLLPGGAAAQDRQRVERKRLEAETKAKRDLARDERHRAREARSLALSTLEKRQREHPKSL